MAQFHKIYIGFSVNNTLHTMTIMNVPFIDLTQIRDQIKEDTVEPGIINAAPHLAVTPCYLV